MVLSKKPITLKTLNHSDSFPMVSFVSNLYLMRLPIICSNLTLSFFFSLHYLFDNCIQYPEGHTSRSIYAIFRLVKEGPSSGGMLQEFLPDLCLAIWTTTPWTIPANAGEFLFVLPWEQCGSRFIPVCFPVILLLLQWEQVSGPARVHLGYSHGTIS